MKLRTLLLGAFGVATLVVFAYVVRQISLISIGMAAEDEVQAVVEQSLADQKALARADPARAALYHQRFDANRQLLNRLTILSLTRRRLTEHAEIALLVLVALIVGLGTAIYLIEIRDREKRLARVGLAIEALWRGDAGITIGESRRDPIGRIATMIEETSRVLASERRRVQSLEHLSAWQEAARRHGHEMRTPLTAAQLELGRLISMIEKHVPDVAAVREMETNIRADLDDLRRFTNNFAEFAQIGHPQPRRLDLGQFVAEFCETFGPTWPQLEIRFERPTTPCHANVDREMIRRVLVNLCTNSALAAGEGRTTLRIGMRCDQSHVVVDVADDGPGIPPEIRGRLFEPYATTRRIGEGMGLGLAISKKILLDHGGDLVLLDSERGAAFRLILPAEGDR